MKARGRLTVAGADIHESHLGCTTTAQARLLEQQFLLLHLLLL